MFYFSQVLDLTYEDRTKITSQKYMCRSTHPSPCDIVYSRMLIQHKVKVKS